MIKDILPKLRVNKNISQTLLADAIGVSRQAVAKWELGQSMPDIDKLIAISDYFGVSIDSLVKSDKACGTKISVSCGIADDDIILFLLDAKKATYAGNGAHSPSSRPASHDLQYEHGDLLYIDTYIGGQKFGGQEAVWRKGVAIWCMNYTGRVISDLFSGDFLKEALANVKKDMPYRGPGVFRNGENSYHCTVTGGFDWFNGYEETYYGSTKTLECMFHGGLVAE